MTNYNNPSDQKQVSGVLTLGNSNTTSIVGTSTTGGQYLGNSANPFGFIYLGTASNYIGVDAGTQSVNGSTIAFPDAGSAVQAVVYNTTSAATVSATMVKWNTYFTNSASLVVLTLPSTIAQGDTFTVIGQGTGGWKIAQPAGINIAITSSQSTTTGTSGYLASTDQYDAVRLVAQNSTTLVIAYMKGNLLGS